MKFGLGSHDLCIFWVAPSYTRILCMIFSIFRLGDSERFTFIGHYYCEGGRSRICYEMALLLKKKQKQLDFSNSSMATSWNIGFLLQIPRVSRIIWVEIGLWGENMGPPCCRSPPGYPGCFQWAAQ